MINLKVIKELNLCQDRLNNYVKHYGEKTLTTQQFMGLKNITQEDKLWVAFRLMPEANRRFVVADIAELVLPLFEAAYPNDPRPRNAINAARNGTEEEVEEANYASSYAFFATSNAPRVVRDAVAAAYYAVCAASLATFSGAFASLYTDRASASAFYASSADPTCKKKIRTSVLKHWK